MTSEMINVPREKIDVLAEHLIDANTASIQLNKVGMAITALRLNQPTAEPVSECSCSLLRSWAVKGPHHASRCSMYWTAVKPEETPMTSEAAKRFTERLTAMNILGTIQIQMVQDLYDRHQPNISASEALYAFSGHLCNLPTPILLGQGCNSVRVHDLIEKFCKLNYLPEPREGWDKKLNPRFYKEVTTMDGNCVMHSQPLSLCPECQENMVKEMEKGKDETISTLRGTLLGISVEKCSCRKQGEPLQCPRCRALEVLEQTK